MIFTGNSPVTLECIPNIRTEGNENEQFRNETHIAKIDPSDGSCVLMHYQNDFKAAEFTLLGNLFLSEGKQGKGWFNRSKKYFVRRFLTVKNRSIEL